MEEQKLQKLKRKSIFSQSVERYAVEGSGDFCHSRRRMKKDVFIPLNRQGKGWNGITQHRSGKINRKRCPQSIRPWELSFGMKTDENLLSFCHKENHQ